MLHLKKTGLDPKDAEQVWTSLETETPRFDYSNWLYYLGAFVIISAMTWLLNLSWHWYSGGAVLLLSSLYALMFFILGHILWKKEHLKTPAGLLITSAICMTPLIIYGLGTYLKIIPVNGVALSAVRMSMELGTVIVGLIAIWFYAFPFLTAPIFFSSWLFFNELTAMPYNSAWPNIIFGLGLLVTAYLLEKYAGNSYAFWAYLFGALLFWFGLTTLMSNQSEPIFFLYLLLNIGLMALSIFLQKTILMVLGAIGTFFYLGHLAYTIFGDTLLFPIALCLIGLAIIYVGFFLQKKTMNQ